MTELYPKTKEKEAFKAEAIQKTAATNERETDDHASEPWKLVQREKVLSKLQRNA